MGLTTTIVIDKVLETSVLNVLQGVNTVERITYDNTSKNITVDDRSAITISMDEFLDFISQINIFETSILTNFNSNPFLTTPFGSCNCTENRDIGAATWGLVCIFGGIPRLCNYLCNITLKTIDLANRAGPKTISFVEWVYFILHINHYNKSLRGI